MSVQCKTTSGQLSLINMDELNVMRVIFNLVPGHQVQSTVTLTLTHRQRVEHHGTVIQ